MQKFPYFIALQEILPQISAYWESFQDFLLSTDFFDFFFENQILRSTILTDLDRVIKHIIQIPDVKILGCWLDIFVYSSYKLHHLLVF